MTGRQGLQSRFAGQVLHKTTESWGTCLLFGAAEPVCRAGTTQNDRIVVYLHSFRDCRAGLQGRYYTKRPNRGVPALGPCLGDGETGAAEPVCRAGTTQISRIVVYLHSFRDCRAGLRDRYYTERPNRGVPALGTCLGDGETGAAEPVCGTGTTQISRIVVYLP